MAYKKYNIKVICCQQDFKVLQFTPDHVETGVAQDDTDTVSIVLKNTGLAELNDVSLIVVYQNGNPAPDWVHINSAVDQGSIQVGRAKTDQHIL